MPEIVFFIGFPGSGKSTYYDAHYSSHMKISTDMFIESYANSVNKTYKDVFQEHYKTAENNMNELFGYCIQNGKDMVVDRTNLYFKSRNKFISKLPSIYTVNYVYFDVPLDVLIERNNNRKQFGRDIPEKVFLQSVQLPEKYEVIKYER